MASTTPANDNNTNSKPPDSELSEESKEAEAVKELQNVINAFRWYFFYVQQRLEKNTNYFNSLPLNYKKLVPDFEESILQLTYGWWMKNYYLLWQLSTNITINSGINDIKRERWTMDNNINYWITTENDYTRWLEAKRNFLWIEIYNTKIREASKRNYELLLRVLPPQPSEKVTRPSPSSEAGI